jgi:UDP-glucose 4-epimerase
VSGSRPLTWVIGGGGLLGGSVVEAQRARGEVWSAAATIRWADPGAPDAIARATSRFLAAADGGPWRLAWCAGAAVTHADAAALAHEGRLFSSVLAVLTGVVDPSLGSVFVASSAGGVYGGSRGQPFDEDTEPVALSAYGRAKLSLEAGARDFHARSGVPVLVGRISNLYGPGQNITKPQGLISQVLRSLLLRRPISIYVSTDTVRDYLFAPDAGELIVDALDRLGEEALGAGPAFQTKVLSSSNEITIGLLVREVARIAKRRPLVVYGSSSEAKLQSRHLHLRSRVWADLDRRSWTSYPVGIGRTLEGLQRALGSGTLR